MTPRQLEALNFIKSFIKENGYSPKFTEIGDGIGMKSNSGVHSLVHILIEQGKISMSPGRSRSIYVVPDDVFDAVHHLSNDELLHICRMRGIV
jgi:repressor LexA